MVACQSVPEFLFHKFIDHNVEEDPPEVIWSDPTLCLCRNHLSAICSFIQQTPTQCLYAMMEAMEEMYSWLWPRITGRDLFEKTALRNAVKAVIERAVKGVLRRGQPAWWEVWKEALEGATG